MITSYTYKILSANPAMAAMMVEFSSPGYPTVEVGTRMPFVGESIDEFMASVAPISHWQDSKKTIATVQVGSTAAISIPAVTPPGIPIAGPPARVTKFQAKAALLGAGLLVQVETYMADPNTPAIIKLAWTETLHFERSSPTVAGLATLLGLTSTQVDNLFLTASQIEA